MLLLMSKEYLELLESISNNELISRAFNLARGMVSPTYVGAEIAFRLASNAGIEMLQLAGSIEMLLD